MIYDGFNNIYTFSGCRKCQKKNTIRATFYLCGIVEKAAAGQTYVAYPVESLAIIAEPVIRMRRTMALLASTHSQDVGNGQKHANRITTSEVLRETHWFFPISRMETCLSYMKITRKYIKCTSNQTIDGSISIYTSSGCRKCPEACKSNY